MHFSLIQQLLSKVPTAIKLNVYYRTVALDYKNELITANLLFEINLHSFLILAASFNRRRLKKRSKRVIDCPLQDKQLAEVSLLYIVGNFVSRCILHD